MSKRRFFRISRIQSGVRTTSTDVMVIGAGMAGLTAARSLAESGSTVLLLEASSRPGGRILTVRHAAQPIELGAEFIHGRPPELWSLVEEAGLETYELSGPHVSFQAGQLISGTTEAAEEDRRFEVLQQLSSYTGRDISFAEYLNQHSIADEARQATIGYIEGFNAADHRLISTEALGLQQAAEDAIEGDRLFRVKAGYDRLPQFLADRITASVSSIRYNTLVERVEWTAGHVQVEANSNGEPLVFHAAHAIIAVPLGVLQQNAITFHPVPDALHEGRRLRMGQVRRFTLLFREKFWTSGAMQRSVGDFSFLFAFGSMPPVWWTPHPAEINTITGWIGGPRSAALLNLTAAQLAERACEALASIFLLDSKALRGQLVDCFTHDWQRDALFSGAYSYVPAGSLDACSKMTIPAENTLFFAGEHTDTTGHWGTVHAAIRSGIRAASQVLNS